MILTKDQQDYLVMEVNKKVNLPLLGERVEKRVFEHAIEKILELLEEKLPEEYIQFMNDVGRGFIPNEEPDVQKAIELIVDFLNNKVNLPLINEKREHKLFRIVVETLFEAMKKGKKLAA